MLTRTAKHRCKDARENECQLQSKGKLSDQDSEMKELPEISPVLSIEQMVHASAFDSDIAQSSAKLKMQMHR